MKPRIDTFPLFIVCAEYTRCIGIFSNIVSSLYYNDVSFLHGYRAGIIVLCIFEVKIFFNRRHLSGGGRVRNAGLPVITGNTLLPVACEYCRRAPSDFGCLRGSRVQPRQGSDNSRRARDTATTMLDHSRHRGESATKTVKFFAAHTVNCVICKNLSRIDWMLLNFTPVIQQNCHQPGRNFEKTFCAVDRLSCQLELSNPKPANSEAILLLIS